MATPDPGDSSSRPTNAFVFETHLDSESTSSRPDPLQQPNPICPWRTPRFNDRECERYFDCPTHIVERALTESDHHDEHQDESHGEGTQESGTTPEQVQHQAEIGNISSPGEGQNNNDDVGPGQAFPSSGGGSTPSVNISTASEPAVPEPSVLQEVSDRPATYTGNSSPQPSTQPGEEERETPGPTLTSELPIRGPGLSISGPAEPQVTNTSTPSPSPASRLVSRPTAAVPSSTPPAAPTQPAPPQIVLPRWQPDSEVTYCPICGTQFSIFVRKHHCRKCGRVVCNSCSPHRITIPSQYIVRPPGTPRPVPQGPSLSLLDSQGWYPELGGGERVRLCNPCVPDPNTAPPQVPGPQPRSPASPTSSIQAEQRPTLWNLYFGSGAASDAQTRSRSATMHPGTSSSSRPRPPPPRSPESRVLWGTPPGSYLPSSSTQSYDTHPGYRSMLDISDHAGPSSAAIAGPSTPSSSSSRHRHRHRHHRPPPIPEEDECPVCHRELPPRTLPNFESLREAHITSCITSHSRYGGPSRTDSGDDSAPVLPRLTGMFPYKATEKDCVDSAECSICLEEFEVGVAMARLECLCRFHKACIDAWWERHPGRCPMHQHDGFGY